MKSYLKFLSRNKFFTAIEAAGLVVSLAFVLLTGHFVWQQHGMTRNVPDYEDVPFWRCVISITHLIKSHSRIFLPIFSKFRVRSLFLFRHRPNFFQCFVQHFLRRFLSF